VFTLLISVPLVWFGKTINARATRQNALEIHTNLTTHAFHFQANAHQASTGTITMAAHPQATYAHQVLTSTESSVSHTPHAITEEFGMTLSANVSALKDLSPTVPLVFDALPVNFMPTEDATAQMELSLMELNVPSEPSINVSAFQIQTGTELIVFVSQAFQPTETHVTVTALLLETSVKDAPQSQTPSGLMESVNATMDMPKSTVSARLSLLSQLNAMSQLSSILNFKNAFHALMDVFHARLATIVLNADPTTILMLRLAFALKFAVMERDTPLNVMMETTSTVTDVAEIAELKSDSHATEVHQLPETPAVPFFHQPYQFKTEVNQDFTEKSF
jgi:hypothetical protein